MKLQQNLQAVAIAFSLSLLATTEVYPKPITYNLQEISNTSGNLKTLGIPVINNFGVVGFVAEQDTGGTQVLSSDSRTTNIMVDTSSQFNFIRDDVSINDAGTVAFIAAQNRQNPQTIGVYTSNGRNLKTIITTPTTDENGVGFRANSFFEVSINNAGIVAILEDISSRAQTILASDGNTTREITGTTTPILSNVQINDVGTVVYSFGPYGIYTGENTKTPPIASARGFVDGKVDYVTAASLNNVGSFAYVRGLADEATSAIIENQVLLKRGNRITTIADNKGDFQSFGPTSINDRGKVAFLAKLDDGGEGIFISNNTGNNPKIDKIIATGDSLLGYTVVDLDFASEGLNEFGQIAFVAKLANNTQVVVRAVPKL